MDYENHNGVMRSGKIALYNMDCMELLRQTPDKYYSLCVVDPPYGIGMAERAPCARLARYGSVNKADSGVPSQEYFAELRRVSSHQIVWGGNYFDLPPTRCFLIWDKQQPENVSFASCEFAWTSFDASAKTYYQRPQNADLQRIHPTQKPVALYQWMLTHYAKPGQRILDTHLGSGSSAIAAHNLGFDFVGTELDADYYAAAVRRFEAHKAQATLFQPDDYDRVTRDDHQGALSL